VNGLKMKKCSHGNEIHLKEKTNRCSAATYDNSAVLTNMLADTTFCAAV